jgi:hypothetical protein
VTGRRLDAATLEALLRTALETGATDPLAAA